MACDSQWRMLDTPSSVEQQRKVPIMTTFAEALKHNIEQSDTESRRAKKILKVLNEPATNKAEERRKAKRIKRMEDTIRGATGHKGKDWSAAAIDWPTILSMVIDILLKLLPLIIFAEQQEDV